MSEHKVNLEDKELRLKELIEHNIKNEKIGTAIAITGSWGVGKTFFWKNFIDNSLEGNVISNRKYAYVSLFGLESLGDLKTHIYSNIESYHSSIEIPKWIKSLFSIFKDTRITQLGINAPVKLIDTLMFAQVKDAIICFDDFERLSNKLDIKDVMGLANYLKIEKNCQVILILDESKVEGENKSKYSEYKEKLVDDVVMINSVKPLILANTQGIDQPLVQLMIQFAEELDIHNFRFFKKVIKLYREFRSQLPQNVADSTKQTILTRILQGYFIADYGSESEIGWNDFTLEKYVRAELTRDEKVDAAKNKYDKLEKFRNLAYEFFSNDLWQKGFKEWFEQKDKFDTITLSELANSELISEENQSIKNKIWEIFEKRYDLKLEEQDLAYISSLGKKCLMLESIQNVAYMYEILKKYLESEEKAEKFKKDVFSHIDSDKKKYIERANKERKTWGYPDNCFYTHIEKLEKELVEKKSLNEILSYFLQYGVFKNKIDQVVLLNSTLDEWYKYLTEDIYREKFFSEQSESLIKYLKQLYRIPLEDQGTNSMIIKILKKIGEESEFKKRYMQDIIENHILSTELDS
ncbi:KAP family P-loop domain protein [Acinetobacter soli]|uniref:KAP family P-loop domain protein n=1 Tax=Acinetobacter soli TaxID=487316 RepID=UPI00280AB301|nr:KAP family P-loop domain protein [Acinetobacter soli]